MSGIESDGVAACKKIYLRLFLGILGRLRGQSRLVQSAQVRVYEFSALSPVSPAAGLGRCQ